MVQLAPWAEFPSEEPPEDAAYQSIEPALALPEMFTVPALHLDPPVVEVTVG